MKQGTGQKSMQPKGPSKVYRPSVEHISEMGAIQAHVKPPKAACKTVGVQAPRHTVTSHHTGSQGKHK